MRTSPGQLYVGETVPLPPGAAFRPYIVGVGEVKTTAAAATGGTGTVVYSNRLGSSIFAPGGAPGTRVADDIATTVSIGCVLEELRFRVSGDPLGNGSGIGPYGVTFALYNACPSAGGTPLFAPQTVDFTDNGNYDIQFQPDAVTDISVPPNAYFGLSFSRSLAGIVSGAPATWGYSFDRFDSPGTMCDARFGGFPSFPHGSFDLEIRVRDDCPDGVCQSTCTGGPSAGSYCVRDDCPGGTCTPDIACLGGLDNGADAPCAYSCPAAFPAYKNSNQGGSFFTVLPQFTWFADDITLAIPVDEDNPCMLTSWEVAIKAQPGEIGAVKAELHTVLDNAAPEIGGTIGGRTTRIADIAAGATVKILKNTFTDPIPITQRGLFVVFTTQNSFSGVIRTCKAAAQGSTEDIYFVHDGSNWVSQDFGSACPAGFEVALHCAGQAPRGACCDMEVLENAVCIGGSRDGLPCNLDRDCRACLGGANDGRLCDQPTDCPGGVCPEAFGQWCIGDSVCRDVPSMNCPLPENWVEDSHCGATCRGGANDGNACAMDGDCPSACDGGFNAGQTCFGDEDCPGTCQGGGPWDGRSCTTDQDCQPFPESPSPALTCGAASCGPPGTCEGSFCAGGSADGLPCGRQADCPGGDCVGQPFDNGLACGVSACCTPDDTCEDLTKGQCFDLVPPGDFVIWMGGESCAAASSQCPYHACVQRRGECTIPRPGEVGCEDSICCQQVCEFDPYCCQVEWDETCVRWENDFSACQRRPANDECVNALRLETGNSIVVAGGDATSSALDPGFCCYEAESAGGPGPGSRADSTVWYSFVATETSAHISTCASSAPIENTLIQVFAVQDPDAGLCADGSTCSVAAGNCPDGSVCVFDHAAACGSLAPIACGDDGSSCGDGGLAELCVGGLVPGETYFVLVGGKNATDRGLFDLAIDAPCSPGPDPLPNDRCVNALGLDPDYPDCTGADCATRFDLAGFGIWAPATFECPGPSCLNTMHNDVWYEWVAPGAGFAVFETCDPSGGAGTPATSLAVYAGCDCPPSAEPVACSESEGAPDCSGGSRASVPVLAGECFRIRLGGDRGGTPSGTLTVRFALCPPGPVTLIDPPPGTVDARQPYPPGEPNVADRVDTFVISWPGGSTHPLCRSYCEESTASPGLNAIDSMVDHQDGTFTIRLQRPVAQAAVSRLSFHHGGAGTSSLIFTTHPGNVDGIGTASQADVAALVAALQGDVPINLYQHDIDRSGAVTPRDLLRLTDVLSGAGVPSSSWLNSPLPPCGNCCVPAYRQP